MKRRQFLIQGSAASALPVLRQAGVLGAHVSATAQPSALTSAEVIWSADALPVRVGVQGVAASIAASSSGNLQSAVSDLHCVFAKEFLLSTVPSRALIHLFAFTRYRLYINGAYFGRGPCRYQNQRPEYDTRDISAALQLGRNVVVVLVHRDAPTGRIMMHDPGFVATIEMTIDGTPRIMASDSSWLSMPELSFSPRAQAWSSIEEHIDARKIHDWTNPDLRLNIWLPSVIMPKPYGLHFFPRTIPLQAETERIWAGASAALPVELSSDEYVDFDLGEIAQAFHVLDMDAQEGSSVEISYNLPQDVSSGKCTYIARAGSQRWTGGDTFAFLRLRVRVTSGQIRLTRAAAWEVRYPFERVASFSCSDRFLNHLWTICARSLELLSEDSYVDCADRERVEWTDDSPPAFDCTRVMMRGPDDTGRTHWGDARLLAGLLRRIALTQQPDGQLKAHSCSERFDIHAIMEDRSCDWIVLLREYLESCGDIDLVRELWPTLGRLLAWYRQRRTARGLVLAREWEVWDNPLRYQVCEGAGLNAMLYRALIDASVLAERLGRREDAKAISQEAQRLRLAFRQHLWNERAGAYDGALFGAGSKILPQRGEDISGSLVDGRFRPTAQANLFALYSGIVPTAHITSVRRWVLNHLSEVRTPMSHYYLFSMLYEMKDEIAEVKVLELLRTGWRDQVDSEWQTTWEGLERSGGSKAHIYGMHPGYFLTAFILGARREGVSSQRTILIEPRFSGLDWAKGVCVTEFGPVEVAWRLDGTRMSELSCATPDNVRVKLRLRSPNSGAALEINGKVSPAHYVDGWLEAFLPPGRHRIRFAA